jgi:2-polyprenyl-3-methyl-5-hydroxy-6-metoxy-1,4-benzoquinol methylase
MMTDLARTFDPAPARRDQLVSRVMQAVSGAFDVFSIYLGDQLGLYQVLASEGPLTATALAHRTGTDVRYVREWLEQQTVTGLVEVEDPRAVEPAFYLPEGHEDVLVDPDSLDYLAPLAQLVAGAVAPLPALLRAFRTGDGVPYEQYGRDLREGQARMNRAAFLRQLGQQWIPAVPGLSERLRRPGARIADLGCGAGWSSIGMAQCYPAAQVDGFDSDEASVALARTHAAEAGVTDRVRFDVRDAGDPALAGRYDLVIALECVHDMAHPVSALRTMRRLAKADGVVLVVDERVADEFDPEAGGLERLMYGFSVLHCLPVGRAEPHSACTGTVMRTSTLTRYAREAGFHTTEVLPIDHAMFRFYKLQ